MTAEEYESVVISLTGEYSGIGVSLSTHKNGAIEVVAPQDGSPAHAAGVRRGDIILKVDGTPYSGTEIDLAAAAIRGKAGTRVTLTLLRDGEEVELSIRREKIISQTVRWEWMDGDIATSASLRLKRARPPTLRSPQTVEQRGAKASCSTCATIRAGWSTPASMWRMRSWTREPSCTARTRPVTGSISM